MGYYCTTQRASTYMAIIERTIPRSRPELPPNPWDHFLSYSNKAGFASLFLGGASMITAPEYYWLAVGLINIGFIFFVIGAYREQWERVWVRWLLIGLILVVMVVFHWLWVFIDLPLEVASVTIDAEHPQGSSIAGIQWRPEFTELQVFIGNPSTSNYYDIDVIVRPDLPVAKIAQRTDIPGISLEDRHGSTTTLVRVEGAQKTTVPLVLLATDSGYRVRCEKLSARTTMQLVLAVVQMKVADKPPSEIFTNRSLLIQPYEDGTRYWYGLASAEPYLDRKIPKKIKLYGKFTAGQRRRSLAIEIAPS